ncbi:MAG: DUF2637 domain-containing protein [Streptosporangiaceae bacterium]
MSAADRAIRVSTAVAVLGVAGIAAYVSYWHAYEVVRAHRESGVTARLEPATIDGLVYASSMVVLYAARHRLAVPALARWLLALGIVATLAANVAHGWPGGPVGAAVAAWPGPDQAYRPAGQPVTSWPGGAGEASVEAAAVAAYRASVDIGRPLSERKLAAKFGKTSRRWARNRMAKARQIAGPASANSRNADRLGHPRQMAGQPVRPDSAVKEAVSAP